MNLPSHLEALIEKHRQLDRVIEKKRANFLSDWNCDNPLLDQLVGPELAAPPQRGLSRDSYIFFDSEEPLIDAICSFHAQIEALPVSRSNVVAGPGSSSFLAAFAIWLRRSGYTEVHYIPPLYHTFYFLLDSLGIKATPVSTLHAYETEFTMRLPSKQTVLLLCDPVWYAGKCVSMEQISAIADWQRTTKSLVFVDGSFQYMKWNHERSEATAKLDPELTFRLICPAKTLAVPFFRFAYLLHPSAIHQGLVFLYESVVGGASGSDLAFAHRAMEVLSGNGNIEYALPAYFKRIFSTLMERRLIRTSIIPESGYFAFAVPCTGPADLLMMDQSYFEHSGYPGYCRINLMAARRIYGLEWSDAASHGESIRE